MKVHRVYISRKNISQKYNGDIDFLPKNTVIEKIT